MMNNRLSQYLSGKKSIGDLLKKRLLLEIAVRDYYKTIEITKTRLKKEISELEIFLSSLDGEVSLDSISILINRQAD